MTSLRILTGGVLLAGLCAGCGQWLPLPNFLAAANPRVTPCPPTLSQEVLTQASNLLAAAITNADSRPSVSAQVSLTIGLFGQQMVGTGSYLEQGYGTTRLHRFDTNIQIAGKAATLLDICDGKNIWALRDVNDDRILSWVDLTRVSEALENTTPRPFEGVVTILRGSLGFSKLLRRIQDAFRFYAVESATLEEIPMWRLTATWHPAVLARIAPAQSEALLAGSAPNYAAIPPQVPDHLVLYLGQTDLFPYRWEFHRCASYRRPHTPLTAGGSKSLVLAVQWSQVAFGVPLDPVYFRYNPGGTKPQDLTVPIIQHYGLKEKKAAD